MGSRKFERNEDGLWVPKAGKPMDRRGFVQSAATIAAAAGLSAACSSSRDGGNGPPNPATGALHGVITGLDPSVPSGGSVTGNRTDISGTTPVTIPDLPASGDITVPVDVGTYTLDYTPPANYALAAGEINPKTGVVVTEGSTTDVFWTVVLAGSTVRVVVTGLAAGVANGGSASILRTDIAGQSPVTANVPASGTVDTGVVIGTYQVTYTPPGGYAVNGGVTNPVSVNATSGAIATATFAVSATTPPPGLIYQHGFEDGTVGNFVTGSRAPLPLGLPGWTLDTQGARGTKSAKLTYQISAANVGIPFYYEMPNPLQAFYLRFAFMQNSGFNGNNADEQKVTRGIGPNFNNQAGTLIILPGGQFRWKWDTLDTAPFLGNLPPTVQGAPNANTLQGSWHWYEIFRDISVSGAIHVMIWIDDVLWFDITSNKSNLGRTYQILQFDGTVNSMASVSSAWYDEIAVGGSKIGIPA